MRDKDLMINEADNEIQCRIRALPMVRDMAKCDKIENSLCTLENKALFHNEPSKSSFYQP